MTPEVEWTNVWAAFESNGSGFYYQFKSFLGLKTNTDSTKLHVREFNSIKPVLVLNKANTEKKNPTIYKQTSNNVVFLNAPPSAREQEVVSSRRRMFSEETGTTKSPGFEPT